MEEITVKKYKASDGKVFDTIGECLKHEKRLSIISEVNEFILYIQGICSESECCECPFYTDSRCRFGCLPPCDWEFN